MSETPCADIDSVLIRLTREIKRNVGSETKTVTVNRCDLVEAIREIDILRAEIKEMNAIQPNTETRFVSFDEFVRFDERGFGLAAVFRDFTHREFSLCKNALKERIANLEKIGYKCDTERAVLAEMERMSG